MKISFTIIWLFLTFNGFSNTIRVGKAFACQTIKAGLDQAKNGDTVLVSAGLYKEGNIEINKSVLLKGLDFPVLDGERIHEIITVKANHVAVEGFKLQNSGYGTMNDPAAIKIYDAAFVHVKNNILDDNFFGIYVQYSVNCRIENNIISAYGTLEHEIGNGIHCWKSDSLLIIANRIQGHRDGIYFEFVTNSLIWRNISSKNIRYGLHFMFSNQDTYITNIFRNNGAGVAVMFTKGVTMINNTFDRNWGDASYGLLLKEISDSYIHGNKFLYNTSGVFMEGTSRIHFESNDLESNGWGMKIQASCMDNTLVENNFISNTFDISTNGSLVLNTFNHNYWDKYEGYDLNKDGIGDVPYHPLSLFSVIVENNPPAMLLFRSFIVTLLDRSEKIMPSLTPDNFIDHSPYMRRIKS